MHVYVCEGSAQFLVILYVAPFLWTCIYICIFMCIPDHICVQVHMHAYMYVKDPHWLFYMWPFYVHVCMHFMYIPVHICMWVHMHVYVCM